MKKAYKVGLYGDDPRVLDGSWKGLFENTPSEEKKESGDAKGKRKRGQSTLDTHIKKTKT
jgi:cryptochrome